jgi:hypothetical protein
VHTFGDFPIEHVRSANLLATVYHPKVDWVPLHPALQVASRMLLSRTLLVDIASLVASPG